MIGDVQPGVMVVRADADARMGTGHVMRTLALAQAWQAAGGSAIYLSRCENPGLQERIQAAGFQYLPLPEAYPDPRDLSELQKLLSTLASGEAGKVDWLVIDGYHFMPEYFSGARKLTPRTLVFDDLANHPCYDAALVLNQNITADPERYTTAADTVLLCGTRYSLLRPEFTAWRSWEREFPERARRVLVTLGGADPDNATMKALQGLALLDDPDLEVRVVAGPANPHRGELEAFAARHGFELLHFVQDMPAQMAWADLAVVAGGSTCWELSLLALPFAIIVIADNQAEIAELLHERGVAHRIGWHADVTGEQVAAALRPLVADTALRSRLGGRGRELVDGRGAERVVEQMLAYRC